MGQGAAGAKGGSKSLAGRKAGLRPVHAPWQVREGPYLAVAPRPTNKYLTFQPYPEGAGPEA